MLTVIGNDLSSNFFSALTLSSLEYLEAAACKMSSWPSRFSEIAPHLKVLNLNYNYLEHLDGVHGMTGLRKVMVVGNRLGGGDKAVLRGLKGLHGLEEIDLRYFRSS